MCIHVILVPPKKQAIFQHRNTVSKHVRNPSPVLLVPTAAFLLFFSTVRTVLQILAPAIICIAVIFQGHPYSTVCVCAVCAVYVSRTDELYLCVSVCTFSDRETKYTFCIHRYVTACACKNLCVCSFFDAVESVVNAAANNSHRHNSNIFFIFPPA